MSEYRVKRGHPMRLELAPLFEDMKDLISVNVRGATVPGVRANTAGVITGTPKVIGNYVLTALAISPTERRRAVVALVVEPVRIETQAVARVTTTRGERVRLDIGQFFREV